MPRARRSHRDQTQNHLERQLSDDSPEILFEEYLLRRAARAHAESERQISEAVSMALSCGLSWNRIGHLLGMPEGEAQTRYDRLARRAS